MADGWHILGRCIEGQPLVIDGVNVWDYEWDSLGDSVTLYDSYFGAEYEHRLWEIDAGGRRIAFGAGETSNNVWAFSVEGPTTST